ncbi:MAG TPA: maltose alpha-D-glucosyltransferase [Verrucomicrobiae bacterium]|nr:maltose alpha-D-glucosyltransferase [Verrucomicrobiae bacterium]
MRVRKTRKAQQPAELSFTQDPLWYKDAVIYQLHVKSFFDGNNDGIGDFAGLAEKLPYIKDLGVNTVWLLPFYPSPRRDDGYDIAAYKGVHPDYGTMADARRFVKQAHQLGLRVITELVIHHTSDQHPWFQRARKARKGSKARDFYVWADKDTGYSGTRIIFCDTEKSNWTWDDAAKAYYWHRFYSHQPDLNFDNPAVLEALLDVLRFWLDIGIDGLRLDAVPYLIEREGTSNENLPETHAILKQIRAEMDKKHKGRMLLAEANMWPEDVQQYFGDSAMGGDECHMAFHFPLMPRMYMALAQEDRFPITDILRQTPEIPPNCQWAIFLRNHDELTLEMVTDRERDYLWQHYASDKRARINLGIRKRLAPLLERDRRRIELLNSLLLSMPGTPVIYYGDEIGMGNNVYLGDRDGVRTPMQWSLDRNGGFSRADPARLVLPPLMDSLYGFQSVNVEAQADDPHSMLNWMRRMLGIRKRHQAFGRGTLKLLSPSNRRILAYLREWRTADDKRQSILCVANVSRTAQAVELDLPGHNGSVPVEMVGGSAFPPIGQLPYLLTLPPYGFYWFQLVDQSQMPDWHLPQPEPLPELLTFVLRKDVSEILQAPIREQLERDVLPAYLAKRRWYQAKDGRLEQAQIVSSAMLPGLARPILLTEIATTTARGTDTYQIPLGFLPEEDIVTALPHQLALARVRRGPKLGYLTDAFTLDAFARGTVELMRAEKAIPASDGEIRFVPTSKLAALELPALPEIRRLGSEQSNSSLVIGEKAILKVIRRITAGIHPEAEMGRTLTERGFAHIAPMLGEVMRIGADGIPRVLAVLQAHIHNQGDAWTWTQNMLSRAVQDADAVPAGTAVGKPVDVLDEFTRFAVTLGRRIGEMHVALAQDCDDEAFAPIACSAHESLEWAATAIGWIDQALDRVAANQGWKSDEERKRGAALVAQREHLHALARYYAKRGEGMLCMRIHGDLHLGQILVAQDEVYIIDFEGEPMLPLEQRRAKASPLRDVAGMLRSFDYAVAMAAGAGTDHSRAEQQRRMQVLARFREDGGRAFLAAYREAAAAVHKRWRHPAGESGLLDLFILQKAAYEVVYEANNRPAWLPVPMGGLEAFAAKQVPHG